jgi:hypothetical protein
MKRAKTMKYRNAEKIAKLTDDKNGVANIRTINRLYRDQDESDFWPIRGRFNATERAIRKARDFQRATGAVYGLEYCYLPEHLLTQIVNNPKNHWPIMEGRRNEILS